MPPTRLERFLRRVALATPALASGCFDDLCTVPERTVLVPGPDAVADGGACAPLACGPAHVCARRADSCTAVAVDGGMAALCHYPGYTESCYHDCTGRRPAGLAPVARPRGGDPLGAYFARVAHLEAASIAAFDRLARELRIHGAPPSLSRAARRAAREEVRHARIAAALSARHGATPIPARVDPVAGRSLEAVAAENAVEGCVRETFGAAVAAWQARRAGDPAVRRAFGTIAVDEAGHAELAWAIAAWAGPRLGRSARARVRGGRDRAVAELGAEIERAAPSEIDHAAGLPAPCEARSLYRLARTTLWT